MISVYDNMVKGHLTSCGEHGFSHVSLFNRSIQWLVVLIFPPPCMYSLDTRSYDSYNGWKITSVLAKFKHLHKAIAPTHLQNAINIPIDHTHLIHSNLLESILEKFEIADVFVFQPSAEFDSLQHQTTYVWNSWTLTSANTTDLYHQRKRIYTSPILTTSL